jgi:transcriptional regulator with XRE-family HTH domain
VKGKVTGERSRDSVSEKIDYLFQTVRRPDGREFTYDDVERGTSGRVSRSYVWKLRHGRNRNPSLDVIEAMSVYFGVPPEYFFGGELRSEARAIEAAEVAALLQDPDARLMADRVRGLSPTAIQALLALVEHLRSIEGARDRPVSLEPEGGPKGAA